MIEMFVPLIMLCLEDDTQMCNIFNGEAFQTEQECMTDLQFNGLVWAGTQEGTYVAGLSCLAVFFLDEQV